MKADLRDRKRAKAAKDMERINTMKYAAIFTIALFVLAGCKNQSTENNTAANANTTTSSATVAQSNLTPEDLGRIGAKIKRHPKEANQILSERGLTEHSFEQAVRKVAENPDQSKRYAAAYKKAS